MKKILFLLLFAAAFMACSKDNKNDDYIPSEHINIIVVNRGSTNATLSVIYGDGSTTPDLFQDVNNRPLGYWAQSITYINGNYFVVLSGSKEIEVIESQTFRSVATIDFNDDVRPLFIQPISETEAIVSSTGRQLTRINTKDYTVVEYIDITEVEGSNIQEMLTVDNKLFCLVQDKRIGVFDTDNIKSSSMRFVEGLEGLIRETAKPILDKNNKLWILATDDNKVILNCINPETEKVEKTVDIPYVREGDDAYVDGCITGSGFWSTNMNTDRKKDKLYFYMTILSEGDSKFGAIFTMDVNTHEVKLYRKLPDSDSMSGIGISPDGDVFICEYRWEQQGFLHEYKENGSVLSRRVGVYPRTIHFTEYDK